MLRISFTRILVVATTAFYVHGYPSEPIFDKTARSTLEAAAALADGNLFVCINPNFGEPCTVFPFTVGQCINFPAPFNDAISSVAPDPGFICTLFVNPNCQGASIAVTAPGISDLTGTPFNDNLSSFRCFRL
ncbi:hypothetical protein JR316_0005545 [Psilocybe cubensis]|uniref:Uncharacterized protein n=2 Tax=Psilocybe cubensis TaxID=181762 RepID=A0ACB8GZH7_PSICU|nr:hypothetical protein JR316_0005545 [Psilocybe cubensis]KAH9481026.1 hypothetical protein JR316_0005545 [Psilocybe cubensis]